MFMTVKEVSAAVGMSQAGILAAEGTCSFPLSYVTTEGRVWNSQDIAEWMFRNALPGEMPLQKAHPESFVS